jgi:hypothetical protein
MGVMVSVPCPGGSGPNPSWGSTRTKVNRESSPRSLRRTGTPPYRASSRPTGWISFSGRNMHTGWNEPGLPGAARVPLRPGPPFRLSGVAAAAHRPEEPEPVPDHAPRGARDFDQSRRA